MIWEGCIRGDDSVGYHGTMHSYLAKRLPPRTQGIVQQLIFRNTGGRENARLLARIQDRRSMPLHQDCYRQFIAQTHPVLTSSMRLVIYDSSSGNPYFLSQYGKKQSPTNMNC